MKNLTTNVLATAWYTEESILSRWAQAVGITRLRFKLGRSRTLVVISIIDKDGKPVRNFNLGQTRNLNNGDIKGFARFVSLGLRPVATGSPRYAVVNFNHLMPGRSPQETAEVIREIQNRGYRLAIDFRPYVTREELSAAFALKPSVVKLG